MDVVAVAVITLAGRRRRLLSSSPGRCGRCSRSPRPPAGCPARRWIQRIRYTGVDDEVAELASTFDAMLDRLAESFEAQKRFVANASHELRTPLAVMRTEIDVTMSDPDVDMAEYRRMAVVVRDASERMNALIESLLVLARSRRRRAGGWSARCRTDLGRGVPPALSSVEREAGRLGLDDRDRPAAGSGRRRPRPARPAGRQPDRERGALQPRSRSLWVRTSVGRHVTRWLVVGNTGFEVDPADVPRLFEAFRRGVRDRTGSRGAGLGLSIVRAVCDAHGGTVGAVAHRRAAAWRSR